MAKLTDATIRNFKLKTGCPEATLSDGGGLILRIRPDGRVWFFRYTSPVTGRRPKITLGTYPDVGLATARAEAAALSLQVAAGVDPQHERAQAAIVAAVGGGLAPRTVADLFERWRQDWLQTQHADAGAYVAGQMQRHVLPLLGKLELDRLRAAEIVAVLAKLRDAGKARTAGVVLSNLRQMFAFAIERDWMQGDPSAAIKKARWDTSRPRQRVLTDAEVQQLATLLPAAKMPIRLQHALWIMLSCCTRVEETSLAKAEHLDLAKGTWTIPAANQKKTAGREPTDFIVHLSDFARYHFTRLLVLPSEEAEQRNAALPKSRQLAVVPTPCVNWLFTGKDLSQPINNKTIAHALATRQRGEDAPALKGRTPLTNALMLPGGTFTPHDLRRTGATMLRELGVAQDVVDRCLNHAEQNEIVATYQRAKLDAEKKAAWKKLGEHLDKLMPRDQTYDI